MHHATGTFAVAITPEAQGGAPEGGMPISRVGIAKTFSGGMTGTATGTMLVAGLAAGLVAGAPRPGSAAGYVAIDRFDGAVDGKAGGFLLLHRGTMTRAGSGAPDSGTGGLDGIAGTFDIRIERGVHHCDLACTLSAEPQRHLRGRAASLSPAHDQPRRPPRLPLPRWPARPA